MTDQEQRSIRQSMLDGYFQKDGKQPKELEVRACIEFFEAKRTDEIAIVLLNMVVDRDILIGSFDMARRQPTFIVNDIKTH